ncbi:MAG: acyl-CoA desaturase [Crocinitomicaceae bacterium]|nr:acyl-CoA desaturase [Crocinitomicaceae bacterium]
MQTLPPLKYSQKIGREFTATLNKRVRAYFKENSISRHANLNMKIKTAFMISLFFIPLGFLLSTLVQSVWLTGLLYLLMGLGTAGIGLSIMHDANHGAYSKKDRVNKFLGGILNLIGGYAPTWRMQHNVLHHTYTNVHGYDEDIKPPKVLRFSPNEDRKKIHRFQHWYAWIFYGLMTFSWITAKDFRQLHRYKKLGILKTEKDSYGTLLARLIMFKILYYILVLVLPLLIIDIAWYWFPIFIFMYHFVAGLILALVFQPAHVIPETEFVDAKNEGYIEDAFAIHQMKTTANFAPKSRVLYWLIGGLNYQVEHHLFPNICHVHYKKLSKIVRETAEEYGVPYNSHTTFFRAIAYHTRLLKTLGKA